MLMLGKPQPSWFCKNSWFFPQEPKRSYQQVLHFWTSLKHFYTGLELRGFSVRIHHPEHRNTEFWDNVSEIETYILTFSTWENLRLREKNPWCVQHVQKGKKGMLRNSKGFFFKQISMEGGRKQHMVEVSVWLYWAIESCCQHLLRVSPFIFLKKIFFVVVYEVLNLFFRDIFVFIFLIDLEILAQT